MAAQRHWVPHPDEWKQPRRHKGGKGKEGKGKGGTSDSDDSVTSDDWLMADEEDAGRGTTVPARTTKELDRIRRGRDELLRQVQELSSREQELEDGRSSTARPSEPTGASIFGSHPSDVFADLSAGRERTSPFSPGTKLAAEGSPPG